MSFRRIFLLSPARCDGRRAQLVLRPGAQLPLAVRLRDGEGAPLGEVFSFLSGLYFRGKLTYAHAFEDPPDNAPPVLIITTDRGLRPPEELVRRDDLLEFGCVDIAAGDERFEGPLRRDAEALAETLADPTDRVVLLGSIATGKYTAALIEVFGDRLVFPADFVGRGDMSRGGLMLRRASLGEELAYTPVAGAVLHGKRPPKLERLRRS